MTKYAALAAVLVVLGACGASDDPAVEAPTSTTSTPTTMAAPQGQGVVGVQNSSFAPSTVQVKVGQKVTWTFRDAFAHTATAADGSFDSGNRSNGDTFEHTFTKAGSFTYRCKLHSSMTGTVAVS